MSIPKPKHCGQNWLDMTPAEGGRICGGCDKLIVDFTKCTWREIEEVQAANNNTVCGMYTDKQLQHWGQQPPANSCSKIAASLALFASLASVTPANGQVQDSSKVRTVIHGKIVDIEGAPLDAFVVLKGTKCGTVSKPDGSYTIDVTDYIDTLTKPTLLYKSIGMEDATANIPNRRGEIECHIVLVQPHITYFYVEEPKLVDTLLHVIKRKKK